MQASALLGTFLPLLLISSLSPPGAFGQWSAKVEVGAERFWGGSIENAPERRSFRPYRPTTFQAGAEHRSGPLGFGLGLGYTEAGLALEGSDAVAAIDGVFTVYSVLPEASYRIASVGLNELLIHAGPLLEFWGMTEGDSRTRFGVHGGICLDIPLGGSFAGSVSAGVALISSPFENGELSGYELRALWRRRFAAGLRYRL
jgi:hypothetical protein